MKLPDVLRTAGLVSDAPDHELPQETPIQEAKTGGTAGWCNAVLCQLTSSVTAHAALTCGVYI